MKRERGRGGSHHGLKGERGGATVRRKRERGGAIVRRKRESGEGWSPYGVVPS